jgi:NAD(P)-dependent dehydrogenase (short-subunit alcohol dehydrogenase family)
LFNIFTSGLKSCVGSVKLLNQLTCDLCSELLRGQDLWKKRKNIVAGARSGIGLELTRVLARAGCRVIMAVRKEASGEVEARKLRLTYKSCIRYAVTLPEQITACKQIAGLKHDQHRHCKKYLSGLVSGRVDSGGLQAGELVVKQCNLASFTEIRMFAEWLQGLSCSLDYLVLNAAVKNTPKWCGL